MDLAHLHLILNHFPILGILFGLALLSVGIVKKNNFVIKLAQIFFIAIIVITVPAYLTGDGAGEIVKKFPDISEKVIDAHEDLAFIAFLLALLLGALSAVNLYFFRNNEVRFNLISKIVCILSVIVFGFMIFVGKTGGLIHHPELSSEKPMKQIEKVDTEHKKVDTLKENH
jgi:uncharacterized membrane protein